MDELFVNPTLLKASLSVVYSTGVLVIIYAFLSSKHIGGRLGAGIKKIAAGCICYVGLFFTMIVLEGQQGSFLSPDQIRIFFFLTSIFGSCLLVAGFWQIYKIGKELKLFY